MIHNVLFSALNWQEFASSPDELLQSFLFVIVQETLIDNSYM